MQLQSKEPHTDCKNKVSDMPHMINRADKVLTLKTKQPLKQHTVLYRVVFVKKL